MVSLSDKLKSLGVKIGAKDLPPPRSRNAFAIENVTDGRVVATELGEAFIVEQTYSSAYRHGNTALPVNASLATIADWANEPMLAKGDLTRWVFLDTETSGLAGGTGTYAFLIGLGRFEQDAFRLTQIFMRDPSEEPATLAALTEFLQPCDTLVTFNGKSFDAPLLRNRYVLNRADVPFANAAHLDLLPLARRLWRDRLESRALKSLEAHILGMTRSEEDIPGFLIPQMYFDYLQNGDARPLTRVLYHNAMDVVAMAALLSHIAQMLDDPLTFAVEHGLDLIAIGKMFEDLGRLDEAVKLYARGLEQDVPEENYRATVQRFAQLQRRRGDTLGAIELWRAAAGTRQIYAFVELAKHFEHRARDYEQALHWTREALTIVAQSPPAVRREWRVALEHRLARVERKLGK
ncbi:MAG: ribonuclease H-like domain-containing protein [Chloroflexi bacterium]|nr:ribonuclease H-like domain-containing protein [Chloroflexota bacterium]